MPSRSRSQTRSSKVTISRKSSSVSKSRSRSRSRSRGRPPSRGRTPTRGKSPARKTKSQKKTPSRSTTPPREKTPELEPSQDEKPTAGGSARNRMAKVASSPKTSTPKPHHPPSRQSMRLAMKSLGTEVLTSEVVEEKIDQTDAASPPPVSYLYGGPVGAFFLIFVLPLSVLLISILMDQSKGGLKWPTLSTRCSDYFDLHIFLGTSAWLVFVAVLTCLPVGQTVRVKTGRNNKDTQYYLNGVFCLVVSLSILTGLLYKDYSLTFITRSFTQLIVSTTILSYLLSAVLYLRARNLPSQQRNPYGKSGVFVYDFFMGRQLNPTIGPLHIKVFLMRAGLTSWCIINALLLHRAYTSNKLTINLALVIAFQTLYVLDNFFFEKLSSLSMSADGTGCLLCHGTLVWTPFMYSILARYLLTVPQTSSYPAIAAYIILYAMGYLIFRGSKSQKEKFRSDPRHPAFAGLETIPTACGRRILADGWWGLVRHPNYLGDILLALAWTLPCGFSSPLPWVSVIFLALLFIDRANLDNSVCKVKYGPAWSIYCQKVTRKIIPGVY